jgi:hypothetical protein
LVEEDQHPIGAALLVENASSHIIKRDRSTGKTSGDLVNSRLESRTHHLVVEANPELIPLLRHYRELNQARFEIAVLDEQLAGFRQAGLRRPAAKRRNLEGKSKYCLRWKLLVISKAIDMLGSIRAQGTEGLDVECKN